MYKIVQGPKTTWIDIQNPTSEDTTFLKERFAFHPLVMEELIPPIWRTKVEVFANYLFLVLHYPLYSKESRETRPQELDIIITQDTIVTSHYRSLLPLKYLFDRCNADPEARAEYMNEGAGQLLFHILNELWESNLLKLTRLNKKLDEVEDAIFKGQENQMLKEISFTKADIIDFLRIVVPQGDIFESLKTEGTKFFGQEMEPYFSHLIGHWSQVKNDLQSYKDTIRALEETNNSLLAYRTNEIVRVLTLFSVIVLPIILLSQIFGMNLNIPFVETPNNFLYIIILMLIGTAGMIFYFKKKKWM
ncbi:MAG: magnesium transporter CorA family protein [Candidatus Wildermuthbacteria bacterium]|nr:magnesium transporter CorA family protein [Candidatus Wildermuthbacteria bacterium]